jgi:hypothetical protein
MQRVISEPTAQEQEAAEWQVVEKYSEKYSKAKIAFKKHYQVYQFWESRSLKADKAIKLDNPVQFDQNYQRLEALGLNQQAYVQKDNPSLQKPVIALHDSGINLGENWDQLKDNPSLQKAVIALHDSGINLGEKWDQLKENPIKFGSSLLLEKGLDKAIENADQRHSQAKLTMAKFFKSKVATDEPQIVLKNAARVLHHKSGMLAAKSYKAAEPYFEESRKLLNISDRDWKSTLTKYHRTTTSNPSREYQTFKFYSQYMDNDKGSLENASLTPDASHGAPSAG